jgi:hypothetical protein
MAITIIGPRSTAPFPGRVYAPAVDVRRKWSDEWTYVPELHLRQAILSAGASDQSGCQLGFRYGRIKHPWQSLFHDYPSIDLRGWWVRLRYFGDGTGANVAWVGRIATEDRRLDGADLVRSGEQVWQAWGPGRLLQKISVSESYWAADPVRRIGWTPSINLRDEAGTLVGNRSATATDDVYLFGGGSTWTHKQAAEYLLAYFVDEGDDGGPRWTLGGAAEILDDFRTVVEIGTTQTAGELLAELIPRRYGVDFVLYPTADGFEVFVYALTALDWSIEGETLPRNPRTVRISASQAKDNLQTRIVRTDDFRFGRIRILGARAVVCFSLWGSAASPPSSAAGELVKRWTTTAEATYKDGAGAAASNTAEDHDRARRDELLRPVYQFFGADVDDWDLAAAGLAPTFDAAGRLVAEPDEDDQADYQTAVRETLDWLPLRDGFDYSQSIAEDHNPEDYQAELVPPIAWISASAFGDAYAPADAVGINLAVPMADWGIQLLAGPNHILAAGHWTGARATERLPTWDWEQTVATIAIRTDQRLALEIEIPADDDGDGATPSGGVLDVEVPDAEFWALAPRTAVRTDVDGHLVTSPSELQILRDDRGRLLMVLVGALARYYVARARAEITVKGLHPWGHLVGQILTVVEEAGDTEPIHAAITAVEWVAPEGETPDALTIIRTGFAE